MLKIIQLIIKNFYEILISFVTYRNPIRINTKKRFLESESDDDLKSINSNFGNIGKRKRIIETHSLTESEANVRRFHKKMSKNKSDGKYTQKLQKIKTECRRKYYTQNGKILKS